MLRIIKDSVNYLFTFKIFYTSFYTLHYFTPCIYHILIRNTRLQFSGSILQFDYFVTGEIHVCCIDKTQEI